MGGDPVEWWTKGWGHSLLRLRPCLLRQSGAAGGALLTGIPSGRHDGSSSHTRINYDLALFASPGGSLLETHVDALVLAWWRQHSTDSNRPWPLGIELDNAIARIATIDGIPIDEVIESSGPDRVERVVLAAIGNVASPTLPSHDALDAEAVRWVGSANADIEAVVLGDQSIAYFAAATPKDMEGSAGIGVGSGIVVIIDGDDGVHERPKQMAPDPRPGQNELHPTSHPVPIILLLVATALGILILYLIL